MSTLWLVVQVIVVYIVANVVGLSLCYIVHNAIARWFLNKICCPGYVFKHNSTSKMMILLDKEVYVCQEDRYKTDSFMYKDPYLSEIMGIDCMGEVKKVGMIGKSELLKVVGREKNEGYREKLKNLLKYMLNNDDNPGIITRFLLKFVKKYKE